MTASVKNEISLITDEMNSILKELYIVSNGVKKDFYGIGNEICAKSIEDVASHYEKVVKLLGKIG